MDDFFDELSLLLDQNSPLEFSYPSEPLLPTTPDPFPSPLLEETMTNPLETPVPPVELNVGPNASNQWPVSPRPASNPSLTTKDPLTFIPTPTLSPPPPPNNPITPHDHLSLISAMGPFPSRILPPSTGDDSYRLPGEFPPPQQYSNFPSANYFGWETQSPDMRYQAFQPSPPEPRLHRMATVGGATDQNWEAIASFLAGQVRPGPDVPRVFKCSICYVEFPNAQAFGGHMSSHSKIKIGDNPALTIAAQSKKAKRGMKASSSARKGGKTAAPASTSNPAKGGKNKKKVEEKVAEDEAGSESDESVTSMFPTGEVARFGPWGAF